MKKVFVENRTFSKLKKFFGKGIFFFGLNASLVSASVSDLVNVDNELA